MFLKILVKNFKQFTAQIKLMSTDKKVIYVRGAPGRPGAPGTLGPAGYMGPAGNPGCCGDEGPRGPRGKRGPRGPRGNRGPPGIPGFPGTRGPCGFPGSRGKIGRARGLDGLPGAPGNKGIRGLDGLPGAKGDQGDPGDPGDPGDAGACGQKGPRGVQGVRGTQGDKGPGGADGPQGAKGDNGESEYVFTYFMGKITNKNPIPNYPAEPFAPLESFGIVSVEYDATIDEVSSFFFIAQTLVVQPAGPPLTAFLLRVNPDLAGSVSDIDGIYLTIPGYSPDDFEQQVYQAEDHAPWDSSTITLTLPLGIPVEKVIKPGAILLIRIRWAITIG